MNEVLGENKSPRTSSPAARLSRPSSTLSAGPIGAGTAEGGPSTPTKQPPVQTASIATQTLETVPVAINYETAPAPKVEIFTYSKGIQTAEPWSPEKRNGSGHALDSDSDSNQSPLQGLSPRKSKRLSRREREKEDELRQRLRQEIEEELKAVKDAVADGPVLKPQPKYPARALTNEELNAVTSSEDFLDFVERSSKVIERALDQDYDVLADYAMDGLEGLDEDDDEGYGSMGGKKGKRIKEVAQFYDERWSKKRMISDIGFSPKVSLDVMSFLRINVNSCDSFLNCFWHPILKTPRPLKIPPVWFRYGICISTRALNISSTAPLTSLLPNSPPSTPPSSSAAPTAAKSFSGTHAPNPHSLSKKPP